jgi:hypothetical protein
MARVSRRRAAATLVMPTLADKLIQDLTYEDANHRTRTALTVLLRSIGLICCVHKAVAPDNLVLRQQLAVLALFRSFGLIYHRLWRSRGRILRFVGKWPCCRARSSAWRYERSTLWILLAKGWRRG